MKMLAGWKLKRRKAEGGTGQHQGHDAGVWNGASEIMPKVSAAMPRDARGQAVEAVDEVHHDE